MTRRRAFIRHLRPIIWGAVICAAPIGIIQAQQWSGGLKYGVGQGGYTGSDEFRWTNDAPTAAAFVALPIGASLWFQPEIAFTRKVGTSFLTGSTLTMTADFIAIPLLLQTKSPDYHGLSLFLNAGPTLSFRTNCVVAFRGGGVSTNDKCDDVRGRSNRFDAGVDAGGGVAFHAGTTVLSLEARASNGMLASATPLAATNSRSFSRGMLVGLTVPVGRARSGPDVSVPGTVPASTPAAAPSPTVTVTPTQPVASTAELPPLPQVISATAGGAQPATPAATSPALRLVTVRAVDADVAALLVAIAQEGGISLVVSPEVRTRVSASFTDVPVMDALKAVADAAGLTISQPATLAPATPVVFNQLAVNVDRASAEVIAKRFGVSAELANWTVESRTATPEKP